jgi:3-oxo-5-alpha-steroid 4-dehydrogenase 1
MYWVSIILIFSFAALVFVLLFFISAPYGKFLRKGWGISVKAKIAWMVMEFPSPTLMVFFYLTSDRMSLATLVFLILWLSHYLYRTFIYPFRQSGKDKAYPMILVAMAFCFNCLNGYINGYGVFQYYTYNSSWLLSWKFITGTIIFLAGFIVNKISDEKLRNLRKDGKNEYVVPSGWLFEYISCPHYFGEIIEWAGWAILTWSMPGLAFFVFTFANLFPRAIRSHKWYKLNFREYPSSRKAIIPCIV